MAGYKNSVLNDEPVAFWTFDGDAFDSINRNLLVPVGASKVIIDEIGMGNPGVLHSDDGDGSLFGYRMRNALIGRTRADGQSLIIIWLL